MLFLLAELAEEPSDSNQTLVTIVIWIVFSAILIGVVLRSKSSNAKLNAESAKLNAEARAAIDRQDAHMDAVEQKLDRVIQLLEEQNER